jgi:hypothetical protein
MAENGRPPRADVINVFPAIDVKYMRALGFVDKNRFAAHRAKSPHGRIYAARNVAQSLGEQLLRFGCHI